jgi:hypothetical protein
LFNYGKIVTQLTLNVDIDGNDMPKSANVKRRFKDMDNTVNKTSEI